MQYLYVAKNGEHFPNLPARDLDTDELTDEQLKILIIAGVAGLYVRANPTEVMTHAQSSGSGALDGPAATGP